MNSINRFQKIFLFFFAVLFFASCANKKNILYYQDLKDNTKSTVNYLPSIIQVNDILFIKVSTLIPEASEPFNIQVNSSNSFNIQTFKIQSYLVDKNGDIIFPILGSIRVSGKTTIQVQDEIIKRLKDDGYLKDPTVNCRIINSKVTVLGEVKSPGTFSFEEQNITLNQALGYAGDLTIYGNRKDVLLIRDINGQRTYVHLDLTKSDWFESDYYFVKQNDVIIVNPNGPKVMSSGYLNSLGTTLGLASLALTIYLVLKNQ